MLRRPHRWVVETLYHDGARRCHDSIGALILYFVCLFLSTMVVDLSKEDPNIVIVLDQILNPVIDSMVRLAVTMIQVLLVHRIVAAMKASDYYALVPVSPRLMMQDLTAAATIQN